ncbi:MAG: trypsin-like peptidase domain-containing protein [Bacilli bacterium]|nr:trypsin-like peptidase domain-containing protein [Bacilli bacterium]
MKKILLSICLILIVGFISVFALTDNFKIDSTKLSFAESNKNKNVLDTFEKDYALSASISTNDKVLEEEMITLSKKMTYLLLGDINNSDESSEEYYKRHQDYLEMGTYKSFPRDENSESGYDESIKNYSYASISEFAVPSLFLQFNELGIQYSYFGDIRITVSDNLIISTVALPSIKMYEENKNDPMKIDIVETNLVITYYFLEVNGEYTLCYLFGETGDELAEYFSELENYENKGTMQLASSYDSNLKTLYDYSKLDAVTEQEINSIYNSNKDNIVILNSHYNNYSVASANGFYISDGLIVTSWNFLEKSLVGAQYIVITDNNGNYLELDGIVTANPESDVAVIKLKNKTNKKISLGDSTKLEVEDPVFAISSKTGIGLTIQNGIVISNDNYIQSAIPLTESDEGSPLFDKQGLVVGMNTSQQTNSSISLAVTSNVLKEIQEKFSNIDFDSIKTISFEELKEKYYYVDYNEEIINNNIPKSKWKKYKKIGNIEDTINLELIKASYEDGIVSLRYKNDISEYISSMQLSTPFREQLIDEGFKEKLVSSEKCIYENNKYQVIIMSEFDYLIIVMVIL